MRSKAGTYAEAMARTEDVICIKLLNITCVCVMYNLARLMQREEKEVYGKMKNYLLGVIIQLDQFKAIFHIPFYG